MIAGRRQEPLDLVLGPRLSVALAARLYDVPGKADPCRGTPPELARIHRVGERGAQDHSQHLDAAARQLTVRRQTIEPPGDIVAVQPVERNRT